jgi:hypothetical protein
VIRSSDEDLDTDKQSINEGILINELTIAVKDKTAPKAKALMVWDHRHIDQTAEV